MMTSFLAIYIFIYFCCLLRQSPDFNFPSGCKKEDHWVRVGVPFLLSRKTKTSEFSS